MPPKDDQHPDNAHPAASRLHDLSHDPHQDPYQNAHFEAYHDGGPDDGDSPPDDNRRDRGGQDDDETGIRSLLAGLGDPGVRQDHIADRIRRSLSSRGGTTPEPRALPPPEPSPCPEHTLTHRAMLLLAGIAVAAGLIGAVVFSRVDLPETGLDEVFAANTLSDAGIPVTTSGTAYRKESLPRQAGALVSERPGRGPLVTTTANDGVGGGRSETTVMIGAATAEMSAPGATNSEIAAMERDVLACLRHLRIHARTVAAVDLATLDGTPAAIVVTTERGAFSVRAIDLECPALGGAVLAEPTPLIQRR